MKFNEIIVECDIRTIVMGEDNVSVDASFRILREAGFDRNAVLHADLVALTDERVDAVRIIKSRYVSLIAPYISKARFDELRNKSIRLWEQKLNVQNGAPVKPKNKYDRVLMDTAIGFSKLSKCTRLKVGAVPAINGRPLATGYNGTIAGMSNECETTENCIECAGSGIDRSDANIMERTKVCSKCKGTGTVTTTSPFTVHAEQNAIFYAAKNGISLDGATMYITHAPCSECSKAMVSAGIKRVVFNEHYGDQKGLAFLEQCGIEIDHF